MSDTKTIPEKLIECFTRSWMWFVVYGVAFLYLIIDAFKVIKSDGMDALAEVLLRWIVVFFAIGFVQVFTTPIQFQLPTCKQLSDEQREENEHDIECVKSEQRRRWMIYSYGFMLISILSVVYVLTIGWKKDVEKHIGNPTAPIAILIGCSMNDNARDIKCYENNKTAVVGSNATVQDVVKKPRDIKKEEVQQKSKPGTNAKDGVQTQSTQDSSEKIANGMWVLNIGGYIKNIDAACSTCTNRICEINGGIIVPLYAIFIALMGGSVSLTRRLPEYQAQANVEYIATGKNPKLTQHQFREYLVFQIVQFMSAPLLAILAYYLVEPNKILQTVVLSFTAGFASETILLMIRGVAEKLSPATSDSGTKVGSISGVVKYNDQPAVGAEVFIAAIPSLKSVTDASGHYVISNVPVGEHALKIKAPPPQNANVADKKSIQPVKTESVKINHQNEVVTKNVDIKTSLDVPGTPNTDPSKI